MLYYSVLVEDIHSSEKYEIKLAMVDGVVVPQTKFIVRTEPFKQCLNNLRSLLRTLDEAKFNSLYIVHNIVKTAFKPSQFFVTTNYGRD